MKESSFKNFLVIALGIALSLFLYVVTLTEIKNLNRLKLNRFESLGEKQNRIEMKMVEVQRLTTEERIVKISIDSLGLIRPKENLEIIRVSKDQIKQIEKIVNEKYD